MTEYTPSPSGLILLTGATGFLGFHVLIQALRDGHRVRCPVRSEEKVQALYSNPHIQAIKPGDRLSTVIIPDLTAYGAYDSACKDATHIIHLASPFDHTLQSSDQDLLRTQIVEPIVKGVIVMLDSAKKANANTNTLKRVLISSTGAAIVDMGKHYSMSEEERKNHIFQATDRNENCTGPLMNAFHAYAVGKAHALNTAETWFLLENPAFDISHTIATFVIGPNMLWKSKKDSDILYGSNEHVMNIVLGTNRGDQSMPIPFGSVHIDDVVKATLALTLHENIPRGASFALNAAREHQGAEWNDAKRIVEEEFAEEEFAEEVRMGILRNDGDTPAISGHLDGSGTEELLGFRCKGYREQVKDLVGFYLGLEEGGE